MAADHQHSVLQTLGSVSLRERARDAIRISIITGELEPGLIFSATSLSARLGVSPTPVREALLDLSKARLVEPVRNRGYRVVTPDEHELDEIGDLRLLLEVPSVRPVVELASDRELESLGECVERLEATAAAGDVAGFLHADRAFHARLLMLTGNNRLARFVGELRDQVRLVALSELARSGELVTSAAEHRAIWDALRARNADLAERLMHRHIRHTRGIWAGRAEAE